LLIFYIETLNKIFCSTFFWRCWSTAFY